MVNTTQIKMSDDATVPESALDTLVKTFGDADAVVRVLIVVFEGLDSIAIDQ